MIYPFHHTGRKKMQLRSIAHILIGLSAATAAAAFEATPATAQEESRPFVRVSYIPGSVALPVLVGIERGFFRREGLTVSAIPVVNQQAVVNSLARGYTDFASGSQAWLLDMANAKAPIKVVALSGYGRELELIVPSWDKKTKSIKDLAGKSVLIVRGTHNFDAVPEFYRMLAFNRMSLASVPIRFIDLAQLRSILDPKYRTAYLKRKVGAILTYKEYTRYYHNQKSARVVMGNDEIKKLIGRISPRPLIANADFLKSKKATAQKFVTAWVKTLKYIEENKKDAAIVLSIYYGRQYGLAIPLPEAETLVGLIRYDRVKWEENDTKAANINARAISAARNILFASIKEKEKRPFKTAPKIDSLIDSSLVEKALASEKAPEKKAEDVDEPSKNVKGSTPKQTEKSDKENKAPSIPEQNSLKRNKPKEPAKGG